MERRGGESAPSPRKPWFISTLWFADYLIRKAATLEDLKEAEKILKWVAEHALPSGVLAEQLNPSTGEPLSELSL